MLFFHAWPFKLNIGVSKRQTREDQRPNTEACYSQNLMVIQYVSRQYYTNILPTSPFMSHLCLGMFPAWMQQNASTKLSCEHSHIGQLSEAISDTTFAKWQRGSQSGFYEYLCMSCVCLMSLVGMYCAS